MALNTIQNDEIFIDGVEGYGFQKVHNLSKAIIVNILSRFFDKRIQAYRLAMPDLTEYQNSDANPQKFLYIMPEFPYYERRVPGLVVKVDNVKEKKLYIGTDSLIGLSHVGSDYVASYFGAADIPVSITVMAESSDMRSDLLNYINMCFTHYHRWHYIFVGDDGSSFSIVPSQSTLSFGSNFEVKEGDQKYIYGSVVNFTGYCDYIFTDNLAASTYRLINTFEINPASGATTSN